MSTQIEKEFKNLLTKEEYEQLLVHYQLDESAAIHQTNTYYDTDDRQLQSLKMGLRIRTYDNDAELTLKVLLQENEQLEITDALSLVEANQLISDKKIKNAGHVASMLKKENIDLDRLKPVGQLSTVRHTFSGEGGVYFLDKSYYQDQKDYELEFETEDLEKGLILFNTFLTYHEIKERKTTQKIQRALQYPNSEKAE
jgi:uncharacterized protein YjbK